MENDRQVDVYIEVLTAIVQRFMRLMGEPALRLARRIYGLRVEDDGTVTRFQGDGMIIVQGLVIEYMTLLGTEILPMTQRAITPARQRHPDVRMPSLLK